VCEGESDNDGRERALSSTDDVASIDRNLDVAGRGRDDGVIGAARWVRVSAGWLADEEDGTGKITTYPDPEGSPETPEGMLVGAASVRVLVLLPGIPEEGSAVMKDVSV
jgi:hypothetical protein